MNDDLLKSSNILLKFVFINNMKLPNKNEESVLFQK